MKHSGISSAINNAAHQARCKGLADDSGIDDTREYLGRFLSAKVTGVAANRGLFLSTGTALGPSSEIWLDHSEIKALLAYISKRFPELVHPASTPNPTNNASQT